MHTLCSLVMLPLLGCPAMAQFRVVSGGDGVSEGRLVAVTALLHAGLTRLAPHFPGTPTREIRTVVHGTAASIPTELLPSLHEGVPGFARLQHDEIHLVMDQIGNEPPNDLRTTVEHELVHILLDQNVGTNGLSVPRWVHEGLAQVLSEGLYLGVREEDLIYRARNRSHIPFKDLVGDFPERPSELALAYGQSFSFVAFLRQEVTLDPLLAAARACSPERSFVSELARRLGAGVSVYEDMWLDSIVKSGAGWRVLLRNFFAITLVLALLPLALAVAKRRNREELVKQRMEDQELAETAVEDWDAEEFGPNEDEW